MWRLKNKMYDDSSFYGDRICDEYDDKNNLMVPETPAGFLIYKIVGGVFDDMQEMVSKFLRDCDILSADASSLDKFWGVSYDMPRPTLPLSGRLLSDDEYRVYLYLRNCQLITRLDIRLACEKCFAVDDYEIYISESDDYLESVDHIHYISREYNGSNLQKRSDDESNQFVTDFDDDEDVARIYSKLAEVGANQKVINIPYNGWGIEFLHFLGKFLTIDNSLAIREYEIG